MTIIYTLAEKRGRATPAACVWKAGTTSFATATCCTSGSLKALTRALSEQTVNPAKAGRTVYFVKAPSGAPCLWTLPLKIIWRSSGA